VLAQLKSLTKETLIYGFSTVVGRFLNFILVPFYVNVLATTAEYGIATSLYVYLGFLNVIYPLGLEAAYFRYASRGEHEERTDAEERKLFSTPYLFILGIAVLLTAIIWFAAPALLNPIFSDGKTDLTPMASMLVTILRYGAVILLLDALTILPFAALRLQHKAKLFASIRLANILITLILNFVFILNMKLGVEGIFLANLVASASVLVLLLPTIAKRFTLRIDKELLRKFLPFGITNVPAYLASMIVQVVDRPIVQAMLGLGILGVYQANYRMGVAMMVLVGLFEYAWRPFFLRQAKTDDARARQLFAKVLTYFLLATGFAFLFFSFYMPHIVSTPIIGRTLLRGDYLSGLHIIPIILGAYVFQGMYTNFCTRTSSRVSISKSVIRYCLW
jgi:O-antigen/teichoic acid export membrane protein